MEIQWLVLGLTKRNDFTGAEEHTFQVEWDGAGFPTEAIFVSEVLKLFERVELPWFPGTAWVNVYTAKSTMRGGTEGDIEDPENVAERLWAYVVAVRDGYL